MASLRFMAAQQIGSLQIPAILDIRSNNADPPESRRLNAIVTDCQNSLILHPPWNETPR